MSLSEGLKPEAVIQSEYTSFDGMVVTVDAWQSEETYWITLVARFEAPASAAGTVGSENSDSGTQDATVLDSPEQVMARVDALNRLTDGRAYQIPSYKFGNMTKRIEDLLKPVESDDQP